MLNSIPSQTEGLLLSDKLLAGETLERARARADQSGMSLAWSILGMAARTRGKLDEATAFFTESDTHARLTEHLSIKGMALRNRAELAWIQGNLTQAAQLCEEGRLLAQSAGITFVVAAQTTMLGHLARQQGNYALAKTYYREALALYRAFDSPTHRAWCLEGLAATLCAQGCYPPATRFTGIGPERASHPSVAYVPCVLRARLSASEEKLSALGRPFCRPIHTSGSAHLVDQAMASPERNYAEPWPRSSSTLWPISCRQHACC